MFKSVMRIYQMGPGGHVPDEGFDNVDELPCGSLASSCCLGELFAYLQPAFKL